MATLAQIRTNVLSNLIDAPNRVQDRADDFINNAIRDLQDRHNFKWMEDQVDYTTTAATHTLGTVPTTFKEYRGRPYYVEDTQGHAVQLTVVQDKRAPILKASDERTDRPRWIVRGEISETDDSSSFFVYPLPDGLSDYSDGEYRIKVPYWRYLADLSADGDANIVTRDRQMTRFVEYAATAEGFGLDWDEAREDKWILRSELMWKKIKKRFVQGVLSGVNTLVPHMGADDAEIPE